MAGATWTGRHGTLDAVADDIARTLGRELGLAGTPATMTLPPESAGVPAGSLLPPRERFSGIPAPTHGFIYADGQQPRPFELRVSIMSGRNGFRRALGMGTLVYAVPLTTSGSARVALRGAVFQGDPRAMDRLNADKALLDKVNALAPAAAAPSGIHRWEVERMVALEPMSQGTVLMLRTLHRVTPSGWTLRSGAVLELAAHLEAALR
ncbi:hypothetical protein FPZ12_005745 [Amycolatopsis acidicola]|uniref:Uncharacterized protein n=1 Tax=Amycolatopsis acidicola TaxID=2596893 RepID=A0A5N0VIU2_9PSEU|nr:hypothetical protein [Amycolatopsis acidicola]KAA9165568.1 hypothetical protein FPZ12_005745 [Amycolatopsis acidicola]